MMQKRFKNNESGFGVVELLLVIVIVLLIGTVGWLVYKMHVKAPVANVSSSKNIPTKSNSLSTSTVKYSTYSDPTAQASFTYPNNWILTSVRGECDEPNGCTPSTDKISAVLVTSPDSTVKLLWSGISGVGGMCDNTIPPSQTNQSNLGGCTIETVFNSVPIPNATGLYVVEGAMQLSSGQYQPFLTVQDKNGVITTGEPGLWYQSFVLPTTGNNTLFNMNNGYSIVGSNTTPETFNNLSQVQTYLNSTNVAQAKQILLSLNVK